MQASPIDQHSSKDINEQATVFLERYLFEFQETFEDVLDLAEEFKRKSDEKLLVSEDDFCSLTSEHTLSAARNRIGYSSATPRASFLELCLALYNKTVEDFANPPTSTVSPEVEARLKKAIEDYQKIQEEIQARQDKIQKLEELVSVGGVKGLKAKAELEVLRSQDNTDQNRRQIRGAAAQRNAQKAAFRQSMGGGSNNAQAQLIKERIASAIAERMAKLQAAEEERQAALAEQFAGAFEEQPAEEEEEEEPEEEEQQQQNEAEEEAAAAAEAEEQRRQQEEERQREEEKRRLAEEERLRELQEQEERLAREKAEAEERARKEQEEAAERERIKAEKAAALEEAKRKEAERQAQLEAERAAEEAKRKEEEEAAAAEAARIAQLEAEAAADAAAAEALEEAKRKEAERQAQIEAEHAAEEARRKEEEEAAAAEAARIAQLEAEAAAAEKEAAEQEAAALAERELGPIKDFSAWNNVDPSVLPELESKSAQFCFNPSAWFDAYKYAKSKNQQETVHSLRRVVLNGTLQAIERGSYELATDEDPVPLELNRDLVTQSIAKAKLYPADQVWDKPTESVKGTAHFLQGDCLDVAAWLKNSRKVNPAVVVSVDPAGNGGDFPRGSCAQEEEVWRRTTLSAVAGATQFLPIEGSGCRYVPHVQLLRQGETTGYAYSTAPIELSFVAACAIQEPKQQGMLNRYSDEDTKRYKQTIRAMFGAALLHGHDAIVIPAFGCGFAKGSPSIIAALFHDVLVTEYPKAFKHVTFAITNDENGPANFENFQAAYVNRAKALAKAKADRLAKKKAAAGK